MRNDGWVSERLIVSTVQERGFTHYALRIAHYAVYVPACLSRPSAVRAMARTRATVPAA